MKRATSLLFALTACKAEDLGVEIPRGGPDRISQEDLQRDVFQLVSLERAGSRAAGTPEAAEAAQRVEVRLRQMHTLPAFGDDYRQAAAGDWNLCGIREGRSSTAVLVLALDGGRGATLGASPVAVMLSLAKAGDTPGKRDPTQIFCRVAPGGLSALSASPPVPWDRVGQVVALGPFGGPELQEAPFADLPRPGAIVGTGPDPVQGTDADGMERVDWRVVQAQTRTIWDRFMETAQAPPPGAPPPLDGSSVPPR